jgi:hypothetical protein
VKEDDVQGTTMKMPLNECAVPDHPARAFIARAVVQ